jgi:hypothetical protein
VTECSALGWLNLLVVFATGAVITWYTVETQRLRREAQLQTELQDRPFISCVLKADEHSQLVNVGKGVALSIIIHDVEMPGDPHYRLRARSITHLAPGQQARLKWTVFQAGLGEFVEIPADAWFADRLLAQRGADLRVSYRPLVERAAPYTTVISVSEVTDESPEPRISVIG